MTILLKRSTILETVALCPPHTSRCDETGRFLQVGESRVSSRRLVCGVLKTSSGSVVLVSLFWYLTCLVLSSFVASVGVRGHLSYHFQNILEVGVVAETKF